MSDLEEAVDVEVLDEDEGVGIDAKADVLKGDKGEKGDKGDKGDKGEQGEQGIQGIQGIRGEKGDTGEKGDKGDKGDTGTTDFNDLENKPTKLSDFTNDTGFITKGVSDLTNYYNTAQTDTLLQEKADIEDIPDVSSFITKDVNNLTNYTLKTNTGSLIDLEINDTTYVVTLKLKNQDGTVISTDTIDLPLESVVVSGRYDNTTKKVILTLENGSEVDFSVADLVAGLQTEITSQNKLASDLVDDTNSGNKFVTTSEKQTWNNKLDESDLTDYVKNTDYASSSKGGVLKSSHALAVNSSGSAQCEVRTYAQYQNADNNLFIGKGTLENVITGKQLINQTQLDNSQDIQDEEIERLQTENARFKATLPTTGEVTGQDITLDKTAEMEFIKPPLPMGNSEQESTTGKNLASDVYSEYSLSPGPYGFKKMIENFTQTYLVANLIDKDTTIDMSGVYLGFTANGYNYNDGVTWLIKDGVKQSDYYTNNKPYLSFYPNNETTFNKIFNRYKIQIELSNTTTPSSYEPYTGGTASPNPDYPQEITNVTGDVEVVVENKNKIDYTEAKPGGSTSVTLIENGFNAKGNYAAQVVVTGLKKNTDYYLSYNKQTISGTENTISVFAGTTQDTPIKIFSGNGTFNTGNNTIINIWFYVGSGFNNPGEANFTNIQLEEGIVRTTYVKYKKPQTFTFPLGNEKLMLGDYLADDGIHHVKGQVVLDGTEKFTTVSVGINSYALNNVIEVNYDMNKLQIMSNYFKGIPAINRNTDETVIYVSANNQFIIRNTSFNSITELKTWIAEQYANSTPLIVQYELAEEVIVPYTSSQQEVYNQIKQALSYEEQTNISSNQNALFNVEAYQSTKLVLEEMATAIVALGGV